MLRGLKSERNPVEVGFTVYSLANIDPISQTFDCDFKIVLRWHDARLAKDPDMVSMAATSSMANGACFERVRGRYPGNVVKALEPEMASDSQPHISFANAASVEEVESVYDLTERDFDDLKLYHLGPCRALPPFLLHPEAWTKVLPPHFVAAREEALRKAYELEGRSPPDEGAAAGGEMSQQQESAYVELQGGAPPTPAESAMMGGVAPPGGGPGGYPGDGGPGGGYPPQYPQQGGSPYGYPPPGGPGGYPQQQHVGGGPGEMDYYYDGGQGSVAPPGPGQGHPQYPPPQGGRMMPPQYDSPSRGPHPPPHYHHPGQHPQYGSPSHPYGPGPGMPPPYHGGWQRDVHEEGAFGNGVHHLAGGGMHGSQSFGNGPIGEPGPVDSPHDEAMYMQHVGGHHVVPQDPGYGAHYQQHPQGEDPPGGASVASGAGSALMDRAGDHLRQKRAGASPSRRPDLSSKLEPQPHSALGPGGEEGDESTFDDTRTDAESSYGTSLVSGTSSYTDTTAGERSSRRALILQMAKARMKSGRGAPGAVLEPTSASDLLLLLLLSSSSSPPPPPPPPPPNLPSSSLNKPSSSSSSSSFSFFSPSSSSCVRFE